MKRRNNKKQNKGQNRKFTRSKWIMFGLAMGVVLATVGSVGALNGWFGGGGTIPEDTMTRGLVGYWSFDEGSGTVAYDASNYANDGILTNGPKWGGSTTTCKVGGCLTFDGTNDYVKIPASATVLDFTSSPFSFEVWLYPNTLASPTVLINRGISGTDGYIVELQGTGRVDFRTSQAGAVQLTYSATGVLSLGVWQHLTIIRDGATAKIFKNGIEVSYGGQDTHLDPLTANRPFLLGMHADEVNYRFDGLMDEVRVYNRALSASEIRYHYNRGGPVGHWKFDEGEGRTAYDSTDNNNDGTLVLAGSATSSAWVQGKFGTALNFDGVNDYVDAGTGSSLNLDSKSFTISMWIKPSTGGPSLQYLLKKFGPAGTDQWLYCYKSATDLHCGFYGDELADIAVSWQEKWYHLVFRFNADSKEQRVFLDGVSIASRIAGGTLTATNGEEFVIGNDAPEYNEPYYGLIDDVRIYNYARTPEEIRLDYNAGFAAHFGPKTNCNQDPGSCMTQGLVGYWGFDEGLGTQAYDASNYGNHGILTNGPKWGGSTTTCKVGGCLTLDGTNDYVDVGNAASLNPTDAITIEAWAKADSLATNPAVVSKWYSGTGDRQYILQVMSTGAIRFGLIGPGYDSNTGEVVVGNWYHLVATYDGSSVKVYKNGTEVASSTTSGAIPQLAVNANIGRDPNPGGAYFPGLIDEVRIYNRALSAQEIRYHYNRGGPVAQWKFDEGEGRTAYDSTDNNNDGTLVLVGSATSSAWVTGKHGSALSFDGTNDYVNVAHSASLNFERTDSFSIGAWIKRDVTGVQEFPLAKDSGWRGYYWNLLAASDKLELNVWSVSGPDNGIRVVGSTALQAGTWYYLFTTYDGSSQASGVKIYVNGVREAETISVDTLTTTIQNTNPLRIGAVNTVSTNEFDGLIDDVRIYNYARTPDEIRLDYNAGFAAHFGPKTNCNEDPGSCMTQSLEAYWNFEEGSGSVAYDVSDNPYDGILTNGPQWAKGKVGGALSFDGTNDYVDVGDPIATGTPAITVSAWIKADTIVANSAILSTEGNPGNLMFSFESTTQLRLRIYETGGGEAQADTTDTSDFAGNWKYVVGTYDSRLSSEQIKLYVNGILKDTTNLAGAGIVRTSGLSLVIGHDRGQAYFDGLIDEVRVYNRALSIEEIRYHYNRGRPVGHWKFDEGEGRTAYDSTDNNNDGTLVLAGSATSSAWITGKYGSALSFDGTDDYVNTSDIAATEGINVLTIEAWVKPGATSYYGGIVSKITDSGTGSWALIQDATNVFRFDTRTPTYNRVFGTTAITTGNWYHITGVYDGSQLRIYVNGKSDADPVAQTGNIANSANTVVIGAYDTSASRFNGLIDDVRIYNYARTVEQIRQDYNAGLSAHFK